MAICLGTSAKVLTVAKLRLFSAEPSWAEKAQQQTVGFKICWTQPELTLCEAILCFHILLICFEEPGAECCVFSKILVLSLRNVIMFLHHHCF